MDSSSSTIDFRISRPVSHDRPDIGGVRYRAGFVDWDEPGAFVVQLEESTGYSFERTMVDWSLVARFDHLRPHDVFDPAEGIHLDVRRRGHADDEYETLSVGLYPTGRDPAALFFYLQAVFDVDANVRTLLEYYVGERDSLRAGAIRFPEEPF